jgi:CheY-like chemotaxis protein
MKFKKGIGRRQPIKNQILIVFAIMIIVSLISDRKKCIEGGANDYMTKQVDTDNLLYLICVWLYK